MISLNLFKPHILGVKAISLLALASLASLSAIPAFTQTLHVTIDGASGKLSAEVYCPHLKAGGKTPLVILMHGFMSNKHDGVLTNITTALEEKGMAYVRFDFDGHGDSEGDFQNMTVTSEIGDAQRVYEYARKLSFVGDIALLGHSQGGVVASMLAGKLGRKRISRLVLMAPAAVLKDDAKNGTLFGLHYDPVKVPEYIEVFNHRLGKAFIKEAQKLPIYETAARYTGPVCIVHGMADGVVPCHYSVRYKEGYKNASLHLIENEDHGFSCKPEEVRAIVAPFLEGMKKH